MRTYYLPKDVPHGEVSQRWYYSKVTGKWRRCYVYLPPNYESNPRSHYPVLYLLHGWGENEQGWHLQGHVDFIMDIRDVLDDDTRCGSGGQQLRAT
jgi:enterochelin esterase family protein